LEVSVSIWGCGLQGFGMLWEPFKDRPGPGKCEDQP